MSKNPQIDTPMEKLISAVSNENWLATTSLAMELAQNAFDLYLDKVRLEYRHANGGERQVDAELLAACKTALEDGESYKLSEVIKKQLRDTIARAERFVDPATPDEMIIPMPDGRKLKLTATLVEEAK